ncbi:MAG: outer membrane beta-barrel protein [Bacteroidia bacterium]
MLAHKGISSSIILSFLLIFNFSAKAQRFQTGITFGPAMTTVNGIDTKDYDNDAYKLGFTLGAFANTHISDKNILQFEINFTQAGATQAPDSLNNSSFRLTLNYLNAGVLIRHRIRFKMSGKLVDKVDLEAGVAVGRLLSSSFVENTYSVPLTSANYNTTDINAFAGIDYSFSQRFYFCARYSNSLQPLVKRDYTPYYASYYTWNKGNNMIFDFSFHILLGKRNTDAAANLNPTTK